ncbi:uncharacterized protein LOC125242809 isoform X2 [Megalobrama amblycephala]|uniref:uncharacterized protein LOC125242809 isoform X2 n=1 Tax=Megalobrama amblycephala TaxID=75352 RepID=UPI002014405E|nr:uncharacterized protein LOC125242809 isoform X2 [Megalobrama amblycephala]
MSLKNDAVTRSGCYRKSKTEQCSRLFQQESRAILVLSTVLLNIIMPSALLFLLLFPNPWFCLIEGKSLEADETCVGMRREDHSYDFDLPETVTVNVQKEECDLEWTIDSFTAFLDGNSTHFALPFKKVTRHGITVNYCPVSAIFHASCPIYTKELTCSCTNSTYNNPVFNTSLPFGDISSSGSSKRQHYCVFAVAAMFAISFVILAFFICRTNRASADEQNHPA